MSIRIQLNGSQSLYTNLDFISGNAILSLTRDETISSITVKLEGESKSRLMVEPLLRRRRDDVVIETEVHKVLYKAITVFPPEHLQNPTRASVYTLHPGQHEFPFKFKFPFNNTCADRQATVVNIAGLQMQAPASSDRHVKQTLPPTLHYFQDQAIIRYYLKATVVRPAFYKENFRTEYDFPFFPIEPPRSAPNKRESYARIQHQFAPPTPTARSPVKPPSLFRKTSVPADGTDPPLTPMTPPLHVCIDARLPDPAVATCNEALPLRILVTKLNESPATVYMQLLQIELVAITLVRAHALQRTNLTSTVLTSKSNMGMRLTERDKVVEIDNGLWKDIPLPNTVAPTFETCNISRTYQPELTVQTLKMPVSVYSGIAPPDALLRAMAGSPSPITSPASTSPISAHPPPSKLSASAEPHPIILDPQNSHHPIATGQTHPEGTVEEDAPPTYEEAVADGIGPVQGARREYRHRQG
ncbi:MAG: hypothetical protein Q9182_000250 [Xanthomendoza sp. 2 TL-2023]